MKLPAVAIAAAFAGGILLGLGPFRAFHATHSSFPAFVSAAVIFLLIAGFFLAWRGFVWASATISLAVWVGLGVFGGCLTELPLPAEHILSRFAAGQIPLKTPLRWHGVLVSEPARLPWGYGLDVSLMGVEKADGYLPVGDGMRLGFTPRENESALPGLHAGDEISVLTEARLPAVYKDAGAFDRREFLARQGIFVLATLRASTLLEKTGSAPDTLRFRIARFRGRLRDSVDRMFPGVTANSWDFKGDAAGRPEFCGSGGTEPGTSGAAGRKWDTDFPDGPGWRGAGVDGRRKSAGELL